MTARIQKWGNSHGIRLPKYILDAVNFADNEKISITTSGDKIIIEKAAAENEIDIDELFRDYDGSYTPILSLLDKSGVTYEINGCSECCISNTINISFDGVNSEALMLASKQHCGISNGSACNSNSYKPSYVLDAMGLDRDRIQSSVRISWGYNRNISDEFIGLIDVVKGLQ